MKCPVCGKEMDVLKDRKGRPYLACTTCGKMFLSRYGGYRLNQILEQRKEKEENEIEIEDDVIEIY
jgi:uncharacterized Zn finger protein